MTIEFRDREWKYIKSWPNMEYAGHGIPMQGDHVVLHWGDNGEDSEEYAVVSRVFDGMRPDVVTLIIEKTVSE